MDIKLGWDKSKSDSPIGIRAVLLKDFMSLLMRPKAMPAVAREIPMGTPIKDRLWDELCRQLCSPAPRVCISGLI